MWPLAFCSVMACAVLIERTLVLLLNRSRFEEVIACLNQAALREERQSLTKDLESIKSPLANVACAYLRAWEFEKEARNEAASLVASQRIADLERRIHWLSLIGTLAPMIGLLGTVTGLVSAFQQLDLSGGMANANELASGIWQALLTTVVGLAIALPSIAVYHFLQSTVNQISLQMEWIVAHLNQQYCGIEHAASERKSKESVAEESP